MNFISHVHVFDKENIKTCIVTFRQQLVKAIAICFEQLAHQCYNIALQFCNVAHKRTSGLTVNSI